MKKWIFLSLFTLVVFIIGRQVMPGVRALEKDKNTASGTKNETIAVKVDFAKAGGKVPEVFLPSVTMTGRGGEAGECDLADFPIIETFRRDIGGLRGCYRLDNAFWKLIDYPARKLLVYERILDLIQQDGGTVIVTFWQTTADNMVKRKKRKHESWTHTFCFPPEDPEKWAKTAGSLMHRFSVEKKYPNIIYEIWSEPNLIQYWAGTEQDYFDLFEQVAQEAIKIEKKHGVKINLAAPGAANFIIEDPPPVDIVKQLGKSITSINIMNSFIQFCSRKHLILPVLTWHNFIFHPRQAGVKAAYVRTCIEKAGFRQPVALILSDWGLPSFRRNPILTEAQNNHKGAVFILESLYSMFKRDIDYCAYFCLQNFSSENRIGHEFCRDFGLTTLSGIKKASYNAFVALGRLGDVWIEKVRIQGSKKIRGIATMDSETGKAAILIWWFEDLFEEIDESTITPVKVLFRHLPWEGRTGFLEIYAIDRHHSNSYAMRERILPKMTQTIQRRLKKRPELKVFAVWDTRNDHFNLRYDEEIYQTARQINQMPGVGLQKISGKKVTADKHGNFRKMIKMRPYSAILMTLTPEQNKKEPPKTSPGAGRLKSQAVGH